MARAESLETQLRERRTLRGWSQEELARRSGLSRAGVGAIETGRLVPSAAAALALAAALDCRVEDLFRLRGSESRGPTWAWPPRLHPARYWQAEVSEARRLYPVEPTLAGMIPHDGVSGAEPDRVPGDGDASRTLILAGCDPAVGLMAAELARTASVRLIALSRSSRSALALLGQGLVHVAGLHLSGADKGDGNAVAVRETLGAGYKLLRVARWDEGIAITPSARCSSIRETLGPTIRWVGREVGSGARQCLDELLEGREPPKRLASDHQGVAEAVRQGWADAGVCLRLVSEEAGLGFLPVRREDYDLCYPAHAEADHRIRALIRVLRSPAHRSAMGELPGYDSRDTGEMRSVN